MIITDLFESTSTPGANPYGYEVGQTVKLQNGSQGQVLDIFDDSIEVSLPSGRTMTVDFRDAEVLDESGVSIAESRRVFTEGRHNKLLKEDATYRKFHNLSRMLAERKMSEKEILDLFAAVEQGANATGQNRTALGKGKDVVAGAYTSAKDAISGVLNSIQMSTPVAGVDAAYNDATDALGKALGGAMGGYTTGRKEIIELLRQRSRPYLFSNSLAPSIVGASIEVLNMLNETTELRDKLETNVKRFKAGIKAAGFDIKDGDSAIVPVMLYDAKLSQDMANALLAEGIYVIGFFFPVVPREQARIRVQLSAAHEFEHIDKAIAAFTKVGKSLGVIA